MTAANPEAGLSKPSGQSAGRQFTQKQLRFMDFVEQTYYLTGSLPSADRSTAAVAGLTKSDYLEYTNSPKILEHLSSARGIDITEAASSEALTAEQLVVANTLLDLSDKRSERNKLKDLKISSTKYEAWRRDPAFSKYIRERAENALNEHMPDIHMSLIDVAKRGDISGIKLFYEMTGRWSSKTVGDVNIEFLMMKIIESIQRHVSDPETIGKIADDLAALAPKQPGAAAINTSAHFARPETFMGNKAPQPLPARIIESAKVVDSEPLDKRAFEL